MVIGSGHRPSMLTSPRARENKQWLSLTEKRKAEEDKQREALLLDSLKLKKAVVKAEKPEDVTALVHKHGQTIEHMSKAFDHKYKADF